MVSVARRSVLGALAGAYVVVALACSSDDFGAEGEGGASSSSSSSSGSSGAASGSSGTSSSGAGATSSDGIKNGDESDVDCGGTSAPKCADQKTCNAAGDCASAICTGGHCAAPSATDGAKNGDETDVDCGGTAAPKCAPAKSCKVASDCTKNACRDGVCAWAPSCAQKAGGATCGPGEVGANGAPAATHEDCCVAAEVKRSVADGGPFMMDKYLITAGRMRVFLEAVGYDVKGWIANNRPAWWTGSGTSTWDAMLPTNKEELLQLMTNGGSGCFIGDGTGEIGAPAYWATAAEIANAVGGAPRTFTQDEMDTKVMNCFRAPLFHALCAFDGGRLPSRAEWIAARTVDGTVRPYPWGSNGTDADRRARAVYDFDYAWPRKPGANENDYGGFLPAPGRFPMGNGPYGHADLLGSVENMGSKPTTGAGVTGDGWFQFSFQEAEQASHPYGEQIASFGSGAYRNHWAVGARCVKL